MSAGHLDEGVAETAVSQIKIKVSSFFQSQIASGPFL